MGRESFRSTAVGQFNFFLWKCIDGKWSAGFRYGPFVRFGAGILFLLNRLKGRALTQDVEIHPLAPATIELLTLKPAHLNQCLEVTADRFFVNAKQLR